MRACVRTQSYLCPQPNPHAVASEAKFLRCQSENWRRTCVCVVPRPGSLGTGRALHILCAARPNVHASCNVNSPATHSMPAKAVHMRAYVHCGRQIPEFTNPIKAFTISEINLVQATEKLEQKFNKYGNSRFNHWDG